jgi:RNA polymerase primary sigma factor
MSKAINFPAEMETMLPSDRDDDSALDLEDLEKEDDSLDEEEDAGSAIDISGEEEEDGKLGKAKGTKKRASQAKKKHYTEDSIRLYLQEIGRIRLLRADEEIELARKIADLLVLEQTREKLAAQLQIDNPEDVKDSDWAKEVEMPLGDFRRRLHSGRRAKDKMVQSNLRLVV